MKFTTLPKNGASWRDPLIYSFNTELETPSDVEFTIFDTMRNMTLGTVRLSGVTRGSFDIAPYIRQVATLTPQMAQTMNIVASPSTACIVVSSGEVSSVEQFYFRTAIDTTFFAPLSSPPTRATISAGDTLHLTLYAKHDVACQLNKVYTDHTDTNRISYDTQGKPAELIVPITDLERGIERVEVVVWCDKTIVCHLNYAVVARNASSRRLIWLNSKGGYESYTFPTSLPQRLVADVATVECGNHKHNTLREAYRETLLASGYDGDKEMARLTELIHSDEVYEVVGSTPQQVELLTRKMEYDSHGKLRQMRVVVRDKVKGGGR